MKLVESIILLVGSVLYLKSYKNSDIQSILLLAVSYLAISTAAISICLNAFTKLDKEK